MRVLLDPSRTFSFQTGGSGPYGRANTDRDEEESFGSDDDEGEVLQRPRGAHFRPPVRRASDREGRERAFF